MRKVKEDLSNEGEVSTTQIDASKTVITPFVDKESKLLYLVGKGEASIHVYDFNEGNTFRKGINFSFAEPSISSVLFDRKCLDYNILEVDRFARYVNNQKFYYVSFNIPRRNPGFDASLYTPVECGGAALTYDQWVAGETAEPIKKDINTIENKFVSNIEAFDRKETKTEPKGGDDKVKECEAKVAELTAKVAELTEENEKLKKQLEEKGGAEEQKVEEAAA